MTGDFNMMTIGLMIKELRTGQDVSFREGRFKVKRVSRDSYTLSDATNHYRQRWGNLEEIVQDSEFAITNGVLPPAENIVGW